MGFSFKSYRDLILWLATIASFIGFATAGSRLEKIRPTIPEYEMSVALPKFVQVLLAGGDRYLAANITVFRALISDTQVHDKGRFATQAKLQGDAAWFNPGHEDNYYLAAASLPWNGFVDESQQILASATEGRPFDMLPPFFYAFNEYYFRHDPIAGVRWLKIAEKNAQSQQQKIGLQRTAANWMTKEKNREFGLKLLSAMAEQSKTSALKQHILLRKKQLESMMLIDQASQAYASRYKRWPDNIETLVKSGMLNAVPLNPFGPGFIIDDQGKAHPTKQNTK